MAPRLTKPAVVAGAAAVAVFIGGGASLAIATDGAPSTDAREADDVPAFSGSVNAPPEDERTEDQAGAADAEQTALAGLATVTSEDAERAALAAVPGTVSATELDDEDGFVVYNVEVRGADGTVTEVTVDAGNARVLTTDSADEAEGPFGSDD